ncbi:flagellar basal body rod protein [Falsibacillus pallidus]|uniref:Lia operon protein LiaI n=1 Tax=Falsibacillus pallidus TaxID=493781 RepID=A0A370GIT6_9BACI|nr:flagellar basal body rod protein [Falsibacillus pallidus]RDI42294.1 lia operon protein LiaI [Falsibacillus pallidus]
MKKIGLLLVGGIAGIVLLTHVGPLVGLAVSLVILYYAFKRFMRADSTFKKILWASIGVIALLASASNVPAILGIAAAWVLFLVYKNWNGQKENRTDKHDPFANFEREWAQLKK